MQRMEYIRDFCFNDSALCNCSLNININNNNSNNNNKNLETLIIKKIHANSKITIFDSLQFNLVSMNCFLGNLEM